MSRSSYGRIVKVKVAEFRKVPIDSTDPQMARGFRQERFLKEYEAKFHCWGVSAETYDDGIATDTIGIVELEDGQCRTVAPNHIQFLTPELLHSI